MEKMSIEEAASFFGVSKEAIHNRIRRNSLECVVEEGIKYVLVDKTDKTPQKRMTNTKVVQSGVEKYYQLLDEQNKKLELKVQKLEDEVRLLREQKEQMLLSEMQKIEDIYIQKDEQLKNILSAISTKFISHQHNQVDADVEVVELDDMKKDEPIELKKYLKDSGYSKKELKKIYKKIFKKAKKDDRFRIKNDSCYLDFVRYDYGDLF
ncbi:MAG: DNA-binding protein [Campylobacterales bacterium]|nr:DNA-binding protein [Campylobacterales bacterium]